MILAAGLGTRLKPLTDTTPKALIKIKDKTLLELQINKLKSEGFDQIIINIHHFANEIKDYLKSNNFFSSSIEISDESEKLLETGGGLKKASHFSNGKPFLVYNVDILSNINLNKLMKFHMASGSIVTLAVQDRSSSRKFLFDDKMILCGWENKKSREQIISRTSQSELKEFSFSGVQIVDARIFKYFPAKDVFSLVELYLSAAKEEKIIGYVHNEDEWIDFGKIENLSEAERVLNKIRSTYPV